ncbi:ribonuclease Z [Paenibacillus alvei TS-15]|jgi:ribonuclease Z|uniref:Ribonuclease Z n=1 Tax=Paenibacillus alvei TS-15 TaxID=1117108 RepID=S9SHL5_PAEAL|nr:ribonuclease Z [Paenibacillus alvei]EPY05322.1 ribonuclease Z [Paenibacillus alvei TS-15]
MDIYFLGTGAGMPTTRRNVSGMALRLYEERGSFWMFDCGEGTQHQVLQSPLKLGKCEFIFITHLHGDHIFGLPGLLSSRAYQGGVSPLTVFGPVGLQRFIHTVFELSETHLPYELHIQEVESGVIWEDEQFAVTALPLEHRVLSLGYQVQQKEKPGRLDLNLLKEKNLPPGPLYGQLKRGQDIVLPSGELVEASSVLGSPIPGKSVTILGDTRPCENAIKLAQGVDLLVHEATFMDDKRENANEFGHSTARQAAQIAVSAGVKKLALTHFSSRYNDERMEELLQEACGLFSNTVLADEHTIVTTS